MPCSSLTRDTSEPCRVTSWGWHKYLLLPASGSVGLYFRVISKALIISVVNTLNAHKMLQILLVDWLLQRDVNLLEIHSQKNLSLLHGIACCALYLLWDLAAIKRGLVTTVKDRLCRYIIQSEQSIVNGWRPTFIQNLLVLVESQSILVEKDQAVRLSQQNCSCLVWHDLKTWSYAQSRTCCQLFLFKICWWRSTFLGTICWWKGGSLSSAISAFIQLVSVSTVRHS